jgi:GNAT superfamily N-acetyltransferase
VVVDPWAALRVEPLGPQHDRSGFDCGVEALNRYLKIQASQDARRHLAAPFVLLEAETVGGFYTLSATAIALSGLPQATAKKLPRYPDVPAALLGRLAVDQRLRGKGYGRALLADALYRAAKSPIAAFAVVVDAKDAAAASFYRREGFLPFPDQPHRLFLPMQAIKQLFSML